MPIKNQFIQQSPEQFDYQLDQDLMRLKESFEMLNRMTLEVTNEAALTSEYLKDRLSDTSRRFYTVIDRINDIVIVKDFENRWKTINKSAMEILDVPMEDVIGKTNDEIIETYPRLKTCLKKCTITDELAWETRRFHRSTIDYPIGNETRKYDFIKTPAFNRDGSRKEIVIIGRDITDITDIKFDSNDDKTC